MWIDFFLLSLFSSHLNIRFPFPLVLFVTTGLQSASYIPFLSPL